METRNRGQKGINKRKFICQNALPANNRKWRVIGCYRDSCAKNVIAPAVYDWGGNKIIPIIPNLYCQFMYNKSWYWTILVWFLFGWGYLCVLTNWNCMQHTWKPWKLGPRPVDSSHFPNELLGFWTGTVPARPFPTPWDENTLTWMRGWKQICSLQLNILHIRWRLEMCVFRRTFKKRAHPPNTLSKGFSHQQCVVFQQGNNSTCKQSSTNWCTACPQKHETRSTADSDRIEWSSHILETPSLRA